jgi:hypothetical protein
MSRVSLSGNALGTGTFTIASPNSNTDRTLNLPDASGTLLTNSGTEPGAFSTLSVAGNTISAVNSLGFRNRIINGNMVIDQRNNGASVTASGTFAVDRFTSFLSYTSNLTFQQNAGSVTPPPGFASYLGITTGTGRTVGSSDQGIWFQSIEGFNTADLAWGTANAQTVTLSFWVRSSLIGTHSGSLLNNGDTRSYVFQFPINSANTWEYKTITIPGDTSGTWLTNNGKGIVVSFNVGSGSTRLTTAGSWNASGFYGATSSVQLCATTGATFFITGVQLEAGSVATPFEQIDYGRELIMCQRYFYRVQDSRIALGGWNNGTEADVCVPFKVTMRSEPTMTVGSLGQLLRFGVAWYNVTSASLQSESSEQLAWINLLIGSTSNATTGMTAVLGNGGGGAVDYSFSSEL